jgi:hypothetical protein
MVRCCDSNAARGQASANDLLLQSFMKRFCESLWTPLVSLTAGFEHLYVTDESCVVVVLVLCLPSSFVCFLLMCYK